MSEKEGIVNLITENKLKIIGAMILAYIVVSIITYIVKYIIAVLIIVIIAYAIFKKQESVK